jgi:uncharacterized membrane protein
MAKATLTVWKFNTPGGARDAYATLNRLASEQSIVLHDAATVTWEEGKKKPKTQQHIPTTSAGALGGAFWGMLFGLIFFIPLLGAAVGAAAGALAGSLTDVGIDDGFIKKVRDQITPGTSALFVMSSDAVIDKVREAFADNPPDDLIFTNLSAEQEAALHDAFDED